MRRPVGVKRIRFVFHWTRVVSPAESPLTPSFHPHSRGAIWSLGASWAFSVQPVLPPDYRPAVPLQEWNLGQAFNAVTGTRLWLLSFLFVERFCFCRLFLRSCDRCRSAVVV